MEKFQVFQVINRSTGVLHLQPVNHVQIYCTWSNHILLHTSFGVLVEKCKVLDVFKRYELWGWFVVKTLFQFLHVHMREGHRDRWRGRVRQSGRERERWWVDERRGSIGCGTQQNPVQHCVIYRRCYTVHWRPWYPLIVYSSSASAKQEDYAMLYTANQIWGRQHPLHFTYFPLHFTPVFLLKPKQGICEDKCESQWQEFLLSSVVKLSH